MFALFLSPVFLFFACEGEKQIDSSRDSDGDGLTDVFEVELGTDADNPDTDGDGYSDFDEHQTGSDPLDSESGIYHGGWPFNPDKNQIGNPGWGSVAAEGATVPEFIAVDQHGDMVNLYDFAGRGVRVVLDVGTVSCGPCRALASFLSTGDMSMLVWNEEGEYYPWWKEEYADLRRMIQDKEIYWITVLFNVNTPVTVTECEEWELDFPNPDVPVLGDSDLLLHDYLDIQSYPAISVLDQDMNFIVYSNGGPFDALAELFPN